MDGYYLYIAAAVGAVVLIGLVLVAARSRSRARPVAARGPDALDVADALDAEAALNVSDALDVVDAVVEAHTQAQVQTNRPARAVASRALSSRPSRVRALPAPVGTAQPAVVSTSPTAGTSAPPQVSEAIEAEIVEEGEDIAWPPEEESQPPVNEDGAVEAMFDPAAAEPAAEPPAEPARVPVIGVQRDDPGVLAAATEARRHFEEFKSAFAARVPGQSFAVKVPFEHGGGREFMWVSVQSIDDSTVFGRLASEPVEVTGVRRGGRVTAKVEDVSDWLYRDAGDSAAVRGAFTAEAVKAAARA